MEVIKDTLQKAIKNKTSLLERGINQREISHLNQTIKSCYSLKDKNKGKILYI